MAEVRLSDLQIRTPQFSNYVALRILELNAFYQAGVMRVDPQLDAFASSGLGQELTIPFYQPIDTSIEPNVSTDDPASYATPQKINTGSQKAAKIMANQAWRSMDLNVVLNASDPLQVLGDQVADYWTTQWAKHLVSMSVGILEDNIANDNSDMYVDQTAGQMSAQHIIRARQTSGDRQAVYTAIAMHSQVYSNLQEQQLITFLRNAQNSTSFAVFNDLNVIVDDALPVNGGEYTSILYGPGSALFGRGNPRTPFETEREALAGDGEGMETIISRQHALLHVDGFNNTVAPAGQSATRAELEAAAAWDRVYDRKRVPLAFIRSAG